MKDLFLIILYFYLNLSTLRGIARFKIVWCCVRVAVVVVFLCSGAHADSDEDIVLGMATSLRFTEGRESYDAVRLAVNEINSRGGVQVGDQRRFFRIAAIDLDDADPTATVDAVLAQLENFIVEKKVRAVVVGPFRSEILLASIDIFMRHKTLLLGTVAMSPALETAILSNPEYKYIFRLCLDSRYLVEYLIDTMKFLRREYGFDKVHILNQDVAWARTAASLMVKLYFDRTPWHITGLDHVASGKSDFASVLRQAEERGAQIILPLFDMPESVELVKQWHQLSRQPLLCGFISPMVGPAAWRNFGGNISGAINVIFELGNIPSPRWEPSVAFNQAFFKAYGRQIEAGHGPAPAYDSVYVLADGLERAGSLDPDELVTALEATDRFGVMGRIRFHRGHQVIFGNDLNEEALACIVQWGKDGKRHIVYPLSIADRQIELPNPAP